MNELLLEVFSFFYVFSNQSALVFEEIKGLHMLVSEGRSIFKAFNPVNVCAGHLFASPCAAV